MAEALVSVVLEQLLTIIGREVQQEVRLVVGVRKEVEKLSSTLKAIQALLEDAEKKQVTDKSVKVWLENLKEIAYDMDDVLDEWSTEILRSQIEGVDDDAPIPKKKVCPNIFSPCFAFNKVGLRHDIGNRIKDIRERLDVIAKEKETYSLKNINRSIEEPKQQQTSSIVDISEVRGRDLDKDVIISKLLSESSQEETGLHVISIVGMGGLGKTTLAQLAFNDANVNAHFENRIWVCVSEPFDQTRIVKEIIKAFKEGVPETTSLNILHQKLGEIVQGKRFLLVLDDVWTEDKKDWEPLKILVKQGAPGCRVVVTTRNQGVASVMDTSYTHKLNELSEEYCWSLLRHIAFWGSGEEEREALEEIGKKIAKKCKGLPLSIKIIGGLLHSKRMKQDWLNVLESKTWELEAVEKHLLPALQLSYYDLPSHLKCCFAYCAVFPKDHEIEKDTLIKMWMAQGFISTEGSRELEVKGGEYFDNLAMRSFFQNIDKKYDGDIWHCKMHDMVHDFAQFLTKKESFIVESSNAKELNLSTARHSNLMVKLDSVLPSNIYNAKNLRTLLARGKRQSNIIMLPPDLFTHLTCLRVLDLSRSSNVKELPSEVGKLIHLRYLDLSWTGLKELPETMSNLYNLQTLKLTGCEDLCKLCEGMGKVISLRHLEIAGTRQLRYLPKGIGKLTNLQTLSKFIVGGGERCKIGNLRNLNLLRGRLEITGLGSVANVNEVEEAELKNKEHLYGLTLNFGSSESERVGEERMKGVIESLQPHSNLKELKIRYYDATLLPNNWMMRFDNLVHLELYMLKKLIRLPSSLGKLPSLEGLKIIGMDAVTYMGHEFFGEGDDADDGITLVVFPKLKSLSILHMKNWEVWDMAVSMNDDITIMPHLSYLTLYECHKLKALPHLAQNRCLRRLYISDCPILRRRYKEGVGEEWSKISHIPNIEIK